MVSFTGKQHSVDQKPPPPPPLSLRFFSLFLGRGRGGTAEQPREITCFCYTPTQKGNLARPHPCSPQAVRKPEGPAMHCHLHRGDWNFHLTNEKKKLYMKVLTAGKCRRCLLNKDDGSFKKMMHELQKYWQQPKSFLSVHLVSTFFLPLPVFRPLIDLFCYSR